MIVSFVYNYIDGYDEDSNSDMEDVSDIINNGVIHNPKDAKYNLSNKEDYDSFLNNGSSKVTSKHQNEIDLSDKIRNFC